MTYITAVNINPKRAKSHLLLSSKQVAHAAVRGSFISDPGRILWRIEEMSPDRSVLSIVSANKPSVDHIVEQFGWKSSSESFVTVSYEPALESFREAKTATVVITLNPSRKDSEGKWRSVVDGVEDWVCEKLAQNGMKVDSARFSPTKAVAFKRGSGRVTLAEVTVHADVSITDANKFAAAAVNGIGRAKGYGFGMLSVTKVNKEI